MFLFDNFSRISDSAMPRNDRSQKQRIMATPRIVLRSILFDSKIGQQGAAPHENKKEKTNSALGSSDIPFYLTWLQILFAAMPRGASLLQQFLIGFCQLQILQLVSSLCPSYVITMTMEESTIACQ
jgi:hypothetical protein